MIEDKLSDFAKSQIDNALSYNEGMRQGYIQAKSEWIGLTDKEVDECLQGLPTQTIDVYARRIEAKLKEKNT